MTKNPTMTENPTMPLSPYGRFGDLTVLVGDCALYHPLTHLLWKRGIGVLRIAKVEDFPSARAGGVQRVAVVYSADLADAADRIQQESESFDGVPVVLQLDSTGEVLAFVDQESCEEDEWTGELPELVRIARSRPSGAIALV